jgi:hypothetical protein
MKIAIVTLLQVAYAMLVQEVANAQNSRNTDEASRLLTAQAALYGVLVTLTAANDDEINVAAGNVARRLAERLDEKKKTSKN